MREGIRSQHWNDFHNAFHSDLYHSSVKNITTGRIPRANLLKSEDGSFSSKTKSLKTILNLTIGKVNKNKRRGPNERIRETSAHSLTRSCSLRSLPDKKFESLHSTTITRSGKVRMHRGSLKKVDSTPSSQRSRTITIPAMNRSLSSSASFGTTYMQRGALKKIRPKACDSQSVTNRSVPPAAKAA